MRLWLRWQRLDAKCAGNSRGSGEGVPAAGVLLPPQPQLLHELLL
jgi:hypothetical protein